MNYEEAYIYIEQTSIDLIGLINKPTNLTHIYDYVLTIQDIKNIADKLLKSLKSKEDFEFDMFKSDDIYDFEKIKLSYRNCIIGKTMEMHQNKFMAYFKSKGLDDKLSKI